MSLTPQQERRIESDLALYDTKHDAYKANATELKKRIKAALAGNRPLKVHAVTVDRPIAHRMLTHSNDHDLETGETLTLGDGESVILEAAAGATPQGRGGLHCEQIRNRPLAPIVRISVNIVGLKQTP